MIRDKDTKSDRYLLVTLDTESDKDSVWRNSSPPSFSSVTRGIPETFTPLFRCYGVRPTYLLNYDVLEDQDSCRVLAELGDDAELGTHLHIEFVPPGRRLFLHNMGGQSCYGVQAQLPPEIEEAKLTSLTKRFCDRFGYSPVSFRSGRFGMSQVTPALLAKLGYLVDSSVTPGLRWNYPEGAIDYRNSRREHHWLETPNGTLLELPISIMPGGTLAPLVRDFHLPELARRFIRRVLGTRAQYLWLRPSWGTGEDLIRYVKRSNERFLVMMLHSMEVIPGASPYASNWEQVGRIVSAMDHLFAYAKHTGIRFCTMAEAARLCQPSFDTL